MKLLVDLGNTRLKWAVHDGAGLVAQGAAEHDDIATLGATWSAWPLAAAWAASVARPELAARVEAACPVPLTWVRSQRQLLGVNNHYRDPSEQGADRWLAVLAARALQAGDLVVACAGTALTVEALSADGDYLGGLILPGRGLMLQSMARGTAQLDRPAGAWDGFPQGTEDAIASGVIEAQVGAIERMRQRLAARHGGSLPTLILTGGDAVHLLPHVAAPARIVDNLVILGLLRVASGV